MKEFDTGITPIRRTDDDSGTKHGERPDPGRRTFLKTAGCTTSGFVAGMLVPFYRHMPVGYTPLALAADGVIAGKDGLVVLNDRPLSAETPPHLLGDPITPTSRHFVRNNGIPPTDVDPSSWILTIDGNVDTSLKFSIDDLKRQFEEHTLALTLECGGNGRAAFDPPARGNQWTYGAVGCSEWTGVRLKDVLLAAGVPDTVVYTAHEGADKHLSGTPGKLPISRGLPIWKALRDNVLIAWAQNGADMHPDNGAPLRLVVPGWPGSCSQKWMTRIYLTDQVHDGAKMTGTSYRVPNRPVAPGDKVDEKDFVIIERMPVKALITSPQTGTDAALDIEVRGHAWSGDRTVRQVEITIDFGRSWQRATLDTPVNNGAWQNWRSMITFPQRGYYEVWARATDDMGDQQPFAINWNPKGYLNNTMHRIALSVV